MGTLVVQYLASIIEGADIVRVLVRQLLSIAGPEAQRVLVSVGGGVEPGGGVEAVVGEGLLGRGAQQLEEGHLDHVDGNAVRTGVGELAGGGRHTAVKYLDRVEISISPYFNLCFLIKLDHTTAAHKLFSLVWGSARHIIS